MSKVQKRLESILNAIEDINFIISSNELKISQIIEDRVLKPAIKMNIVKIAEQFNKLKEENEFKILENFAKEDLRGINAVRNYIAHDYDSTDDMIIDDVVRYNLPIFKDIVENLLQNMQQKQSYQDEIEQMSKDSIVLNNIDKLDNL